MNIFETKQQRRAWLDKFAISQQPIDVFCKMNHIKEETIRKALAEQTETYQKEKGIKGKEFTEADLLEIDIQRKPIVEKIELNSVKKQEISDGNIIIIKLGNAEIQISTNAETETLERIFKAVSCV